MNFGREKIVKTRSSWRKTDQVKRIKVIMTIVFVALVLAVVACCILSWLQFKDPFGTKAGSESAASSSEASAIAANDDNVLPIYEDSFNLVLVNSDSPIRTTFKLQLTTFNGVQLDTRIISSLKLMMKDAKKDGCMLKVTGGYVDAVKQNQLFQAKVAESMKSKGYSKVKAEDDASLTVERAGHSEFQTGMAVNLSAEKIDAKTDFSTTKEYRWLLSNCVNYGFILRYPTNKTDTSLTGMNFSPNHFRYVGVDNAQKMRALNMCLEEYAQYRNNQGD